MPRYYPYYADDTRGVHFEVLVDGHCVQAYIAQAVISATYGIGTTGIECVNAYLAYRVAINQVATSRVRADGHETVLVQADELTPSDKP